MYVQQGSNGIAIWAPAKLNLFLEIKNRRVDGFHEIETFMLPISLYDHLEVTSPKSAEPGSLTLECQFHPGLAKGNRPFAWNRSTGCEFGSNDRAQWFRTDLYGSQWLPAGADNLVSKAVQQLRIKTGCDKPLSVRLTKTIPAASGLAGGSSDAAAAVFAANAAWGTELDLAELAEVTGQVGSDVPFFLYRMPCICTGRGEQIKPWSLLSRPLNFVVVRPPTGLATAQVYQANQLSAELQSIQPFLDALASSRLDRIGREMFNRLQTPARTLSPWIDRLAHELSRLDVLGHQMSGSGSAYFGLCRTQAHACRVAAVVNSRGIGSAFAVKSVEMSHSSSSETWIPSLN